MKRPGAIGLITLSAVASLLYPVPTYVSTLSLFGVAHVLIELRYIDTQYFSTLNRQFDPAFLVWLVNVLLAIAALRCFILLDWIPTALGVVLELSCGLGLVLLAAWALWQQVRASSERAEITVRWGIAVAIAALLILGIVHSPVTTIVLLSIIHNLTPIGFIYQSPHQHRSYRLGCLLIFGLLPLLVFWGRWLGASWCSAPIETPYLTTFVPSSLLHSQFAYPLFAAITFCQCMHYAVVIGLFSDWTQSTAESFIPWMRPRLFYLAILVASALLFLAFQASFLTTRAFYSVIASIHAWIEIPLLLVLLTPKPMKDQDSQE